MGQYLEFLAEESGAVTVDWVVLTGALVGLGLATATVVSGGVGDVSNATSDELETMQITTTFAPGDTAWNGMAASDYYAIGAGMAPGNNGATYYWAQYHAAADAPDGYNFDNPLMDTDSGNIVYTSDDGNYYSVGGEVSAVGDFDGNAVYWGA